MRALRWILAGAGLALTATLVWGVGVAPRLIDEEHLDVVLPRLPAAWDGQRIAFVSDFQVGAWLANTGTARRIIGRFVEDPPAAVLLGGDFVYSTDPDPARQVREARNLIAPLTEAGIPAYAVLGNHDVETGAASALRSALAGLGVTVLDNETAALAPPDAAGPPLHVVGVAPHDPGLDRPRAAVAGVPASAPRVVFMHHPASFPALPGGTAPLAVAGHTHCGQIRLPFTPGWSMAAALEDLDVPMDGWAVDYGREGNRLYVSCGVGFSRMPVRLGARPQLVVFTLRSG